MRSVSRPPLVAAALLSTSLVSACEPAVDAPGDAAVHAIDKPCNPVGGTQCLAPFPSSTYLVEDATTRTGFRVAIPPEDLPLNDNDVRPSPALFARRDGFSANAQIVAAFPGGVSAAGLPGHASNSDNTGPDATVVIVEVSTGRRIPLFAEPDMGPEDPTKRALLIRPLLRMKPATRYAVAIRRGVRSADGSPVPVSPGFQKILDDAPSDEVRLERDRVRYPAIFEALDKAGIPRTDLALAWDFVTASDEVLTADLTSMRDQTVAAVGDTGTGFAVEVRDVEDVQDRAHALRFLVGTYEAPMYLDDARVMGRGKLVRGADGLPVQQGKRKAPFAALIPACAKTEPGPLPVIVFGHGLFGSGGESLDDGFLQRTADEHCAIFVAGDFLGLTKDNLVNAVAVAYDLNRTPELTEKLAQGVSDFITLSRVVRGPLRDEPLFQHEGRKLVDPERVYYYGASLGGIMGAVLMSYEPKLLRAALGVPGANWTLLFERSLAWPVIKAALRSAYQDPVTEQVLTSMLGMLFDAYDPITTAPRVVADPLPGVPKKQLLLYEGLGDSLVTHLSTEMLARTMGIPVSAPSVRAPFGLASAGDDLSSALVVFDEHPTPVPAETNVPPTIDSGTHAGVNKRAAVQRMVRSLFYTGHFRHGCVVGGQPAPCDCATGACD